MCNAGKVKRGGTRLKPASQIYVGDEIEVPAKEASYKRLLRVEQLTDKRLGAALAGQNFSELTDPELIAAAREKAKDSRSHRREGGQGRMTKRDRRRWENATGHFFD